MPDHEHRIPASTIHFAATNVILACIYMPAFQLDHNLQDAGSINWSFEQQGKKVPLNTQEQAYQLFFSFSLFFFRELFARNGRQRTHFECSEEAEETWGTTTSARPSLYRLYRRCIQRCVAIARCKYKIASVGLVGGNSANRYPPRRMWWWASEGKKTYANVVVSICSVRKTTLRNVLCARCRRCCLTAAHSTAFRIKYQKSIEKRHQHRNGREKVQ